MKKFIFAVCACTSLTAITGSASQAASPFVGQYVGVLGGWSSLHAKTTLRYSSIPLYSISDIKNSYHAGGYFGYGLAWGRIITSAEGLIFYDNAKVKKVTPTSNIKTKRGTVYEIAVRAGTMISPTVLLYGRFGVSTNNSTSEVAVNGEMYKDRKYRLHWAPGAGVDYVIRTRKMGNFIARIEYSYHEDFKSEYKIGDIVGTQQGQIVHKLKGHYIRAGLAKQVNIVAR